jgi:hypothetical protein
MINNMLLDKPSNKRVESQSMVKVLKMIVSFYIHWTPSLKYVIEI